MESAEISGMVDADVIIGPGAVRHVARVFDECPDMAAVFGSYDAFPQASGVVSQYRNLLHHFVHQHGNPEASTFWAGCGARFSAMISSAVAIAAGALLGLASLWLVLQGGGAGGPNLQLLSQYFPGYRVSVEGSLLIGIAYTLITGFIIGWSFAFLRNAAMFPCVAVVHRRAEYHLLRKLLEYL